MATCREILPDATREVLRRAALTEDQAAAIFGQGREAVIFALLELTKQLAEARGPQTIPSTPSGTVPVYEKPAAKSRKKRRGAKKGHTGSRRAAPKRIDWHRWLVCPLGLTVKDKVNIPRKRAATSVTILKKE